MIHVNGQVIASKNACAAGESAIPCLTLLRLPLSVFAYIEITTGNIRSLYYLCLFFAIAASDFLDGKLARAFYVQSSFGAIEDVTCDFFYIITSCYALYRLNFLSVWILILITAKLFEFILTSVLIRYRQYRPHIFMFDCTGRYAAIGFYILPTVIVLSSLHLMPLFSIIRYSFYVGLLLLSLVSSYHRFTAIVKAVLHCNPAK